MTDRTDIPLGSEISNFEVQPHKGEGLLLTPLAAQTLDSDLSQVSCDALTAGGELAYRQIAAGPGWENLALLFIFTVDHQGIVRSMDTRRLSDSFLHSSAMGNEVSEAYGSLRLRFTTTHLDIFADASGNCGVEFYSWGDGRKIVVRGQASESANDDRSAAT